MTHILVLFDGDMGDYNSLEEFFKWIRTLSYKVEKDGNIKQLDVMPRIMVPINLRVSSDAKDRLISDLKTFGECRRKHTDSINDFIPFEMLGIKKINTDKIIPTKSYKKDLGPATKNIHINILGKVEDNKNKKDGREML